MKFKKGSKVEVLSKEVPSGSWRCAEIICGNDHNYTVRYDGFENAMNETISERVSRKAIRPCPPLLQVSDNWVPGDIIEVFDKFSWKMATISKVLGIKYFLVRLLGSSREYKVSKCDIRARQSWQDDKWVVVGKGSRNCYNGKDDEIVILKDNQNSNFQIQKTTKSRINSHLNEVSFSAKDKLNFQESHIASSKTLKRGSPYCYSQADAHAGASQKVRAVGDEGRCYRVIAANPAVLARQVDVAFPKDMQDEKEIHTSLDIRTTGFPEVDKERRKLIGTAGCSFAIDLQSNDADSVRCSVGSCSISSNGTYKSNCHGSSGPTEDFDENFCDAASTCQLRYDEGNYHFPGKDKLAAEIRRLELHAYRCTMEALHASGPLSWEQEELVTNLRLLLHISNDEHLMELRNLVSADTSILFR